MRLSCEISVPYFQTGVPTPAKVGARFSHDNLRPVVSPVRRRPRYLEPDSSASWWARCCERWRKNPLRMSAMSIAPNV